MEKPKNLNGSFKELKKYLLRSGIPLEASVAKKIQTHRLIDQGEYFYQRDGKIFSLDINAYGYAEFETYYRANLVALDFLIECKYHEQDKKWFFMIFKQPKEFSFRASTNNIFVDFPFSKRFEEYGYHQKYNKKKYQEYYSDIYSRYFPANLPKVHKGIELYSKGFNPKSIAETIFQISFGIGSAIPTNVKELLKSKEEEIKGDDGYMYIGGDLGILIIPVIVTTSEIYVLNQDVNIEDIQKCKNIGEIASREKAVFYEQQSNLDLTNFIKKSFIFKDEMIKSGFFVDEEIDTDIDNLSDIEPRILIIDYKYFDEIFGRLLRELDEYFKRLNKFWSLKIKAKKQK